MAKDPAVLFYTSDFLTGTSFFSMEERGQYITLLCEQHQLGLIPENHMISVCGSLGSPVIKKFTRTKDGFYYNQRMKEEADKRQKFCESRSNNKSGRKKKKITRKSHVNHMNIHMENENENENKDRNENENEISLKKSEKTFSNQPIVFPFTSENFILHWDVWKYYKKVEHKFRYKSSISEQAALNKLNKLADYNENDSVKIIIESISNGWKGFFNLENDGKRQQGATNEDLFEVFKRKFTEGREGES